MIISHDVVCIYLSVGRMPYISNSLYDVIIIRVLHMSTEHDRNEGLYAN